MSMGAMCFTTSGSNRGCWVVVVVLLLFMEKKVYAGYIRGKQYMRVTPNKKVLFSLLLFSIRRLQQKKLYGLHFFPYVRYSKAKSTWVTLFSTRRLHFQSLHGASQLRDHDNNLSPYPEAQNGNQFSG